MYIPFGFVGGGNPEVSLTGLVSWLTPQTYTGSGSVWADASGNLNATISGSLTTAGTDGWTFASGTYLDFGTGSYNYASNQQTVIMYGSLTDNDAVQTMWSKGASDQWMWVPFTGSFTCTDGSSGAWSGSRFNIPTGLPAFVICTTTPASPVTGGGTVPVDYNPTLSVGKQMYTITNAPAGATPSSIRGSSLYIDTLRLSGGGAADGGGGLNNSNPMYFGKGVSDGAGDLWPNINQPTISDILIYSRALTPQEIASIYTYFLLNR